MNLVRRAHLTSALIIGTFLWVHLGNHIVGLFGQDAHMAYMAVARRLYRDGLIEPVLLAMLFWQIGSGLWMAAQTWRNRHGSVAWLQVVSGMYLAAFLTIHVAAVLYGRVGLGLETDFR